MDRHAKHSILALLLEFHFHSMNFFTGTLLDCYDELGNRYQLPVYVLGAPTNLIEDTSDSDTVQDVETSQPGAEIVIKFRVSTLSKDLKLKVRTTDTVMKIKKKLFELEKIEPSRQKWFFSGKILSDKLKMEDAKIPKGYVVQVVVSPLTESSDGS